MYLKRRHFLKRKRWRFLFCLNIDAYFVKGDKKQKNVVNL